MTLIEMIRTVSQRLGLPYPNSAVGSNDRMIQQMLAIFTQMGSDLVTQYDWRRLQREHIIVTRSNTELVTMTKGSHIIALPDSTAYDDSWMAIGRGMPPFNKVIERPTTQALRLQQAATESGSFEITLSRYAYPLPADWHRQTSQTEWDRTSRLQMSGPVNAQQWQQYKVGIVYPGPWSMFRIIGNSFVVQPPPPDGLTFSFEYISKNWVNGNKSAPDNDDDTFVFSDSILMTGLNANWFDVHGIDSTKETATFISLLNLAKSQDRSAPALSIAPAAQSVLMDGRSIPDGNWEF